MMPTYRLALILFPLAIYFFQLGRWNASDRPALVSGTIDFWFLAFGLSGLLIAGPVGEVVVTSLFPRPTIAAWIAVASGVGLLALFASSRLGNRLIVYHVTGSVLKAAIGQALERIAGPVHATLRGFEDLKGQRGLTVEVGSKLGFGVVESYGENPELLIERIRPELKMLLSGVPSRPSRLATIWFGLSFASMLLLCVATAYLTRTELRSFLRRIAGG